MIAYIAYVACVLAMVGIAYGIGYGNGQRHRAEVNVSLITRDACQRCIYLNRCLDMYKGDIRKTIVDLEPNYCRNCAVNNEKLKIGG